MQAGKPQFLLFLFLCLKFMAIAQKTAETNSDTLFTCDRHIEKIIPTDAKSLYHGQLKVFNKNGGLTSIKNYSHGFLDGPSIFFNGKGDTLSVTNWKHNILHGLTAGYYPNGKKMFFENYFAGKLDGSIIYFDTTGKPFSGKLDDFHFLNGDYFQRVVSCVDGKPKDELLIYEGENGELIKRVNFLDGLPDLKAYKYNNSEVISISHFEKGKYQKELDQNFPYHIFIYTNFLKEEPASEHFLYLRALAYLRIGATQKSLDDLDKVIVVNKENYKAYYNRAVILGDSLPKLAMKDLGQTLKIQKDFYLAYYNLGILLYRDSQYRKARDNFESCIRINPVHLPSIHNLAMIYGILGDKNMEEYYKNEFKRIRSHK